MKKNKLPCWLKQSRICLQFGRPLFDPWIGKIVWRRKWQPTSVYLPGESHGQRNLVVHGPRDHKESDNRATKLKYTHWRKICLHWGKLLMIVHKYFYFNYHFYSFNVLEQKDQHLALRLCASFKNEVGLLWVIQFDIHFPIVFLK